MIPTLIFYNSVLLVSSLFIFLAEKFAGSKKARVFACFAFLAVFLSIALRYEVGTDYFSYKIIFEEIRDNLLPSMSVGIEPGFYALNWLVIKAGLSFEWLIGLIALITTTFFFASYPEKNKTLFHLVLWSVVYFISFNLLRSMLAASIALFAIMQFLKNKSYTKYVILILIAMLFHKSVILLVILPFIKQLKFLEKKWIKRYLLPISIFVVAIFSAQIVSFVINSPIIHLLGFSSYVDSWYNKPTVMGSGLGVLAFLVFFIYTIFVLGGSARKNSFALLLITATALAIIFAANVTMFYRLKVLFIIVYPIAAWLLLSNSKSPLSYLALAGFVCLNLIDFNRVIINGSTDYRVTCRGERVTPYVSVFNKEDSTRHPHITRYGRFCDQHYLEKGQEPPRKKIFDE